MFNFPNSQAIWELHEKPILIGHSLGGFLSLSMASIHPDLVYNEEIVPLLEQLEAMKNKT